MTENKIETCEMLVAWDDATDEWVYCGKTATVAHWDCCGGYNTSYYCSDCAFEGGDTENCQWENYDLDGNLLGSNQ